MGFSGRAVVTSTALIDFGQRYPNNPKKIAVEAAIVRTLFKRRDGKSLASRDRIALS